MKLQYLTPGPSELYFTVADHLRTAVQEQVGSISHRSKTFEGYYAKAAEGIRQVLDVPPTHQVLFTASATEVWERLLQNCVGQSSFHLVNGSFSKRFFQFAEQLQLAATKMEKPLGEGFTAAEIEVPPAAELIAVTQNETSAGVYMPSDEVTKLKQRYPDKLVVVDAVSAIPYPQYDFSAVDSLYFSVQKGMGLPAGLGVWIVSQACIDKAEQLLQKGKSIGTYHSLPSLLEKAAKNQTPETPNVLGIYLLGKVCEDLLRRGMDRIRQETRYKAALMYGTFERSSTLQPFVKEKLFRSPTVNIAALPEERSSLSLIAELKESGIVVGSGYGPFKDRHIRVANFPAHSKETFERLADKLESICG